MSIVMGFILITISASCSGRGEGSPPQAENFGDSGDDLGDLGPFRRGGHPLEAGHSGRGIAFGGVSQTLEDALVAIVFMSIAMIYVSCHGSCQLTCFMSIDKFCVN